jgi:hypothetical protein
MFLDVDPDVFSVGLVGIGLIQFPLEQEDLEGGNSTADAGDAEDSREEYREQFPQDVDKKSEPDQQQPYNEKSGCEVSGGLGDGVAVKPKTHFQTSL